MYYCKIFAIYLYISVLLIYKAQCTGTHRNGTGSAKETSTHTGNLTQGTSSTANNPDASVENGTTPVTPKTYPEKSLNLSDLKLENDENGIYKEFQLDDWKINTFRSFVGKNYNTLKLDGVKLWPEERSNESIYEFLIFKKDKKYMISLTSLKSEGYLSNQFIHAEIDSANASKTKVEMMTNDEFLQKFQQVLDSKLIPPFPNGLPKDVFYQKYRLYKARSSDPSAGADLEIV